MAEHLVAGLAQQVFPDSPAFQLRGDEGRHALLSALEQPRWPYHRTLQEKAGILHYVLNKSHPFADGNKRFALTAMETFLLLNRACLLASADEAEAFALGVAAGSISRDEAIAFVVRRTVRTHWSEARIERWLHSLPESDRSAVSLEVNEPTGRLLTFLRSLRLSA